ncbi:MAG: hypothetical protein ACLQDM_07900 [Bradyrhizobium sp.]
MTKLVLRFVTLETILVALIAAPSFTPAFAMGGGGGGAGAGGTGSSGYPAALMRLDPPEPPSSYSRRSGIKSTHKINKTTRHSSIRQPGT